MKDIEVNNRLNIEKKPNSYNLYLNVEKPSNNSNFKIYFIKDNDFWNLFWRNNIYTWPPIQSVIYASNYGYNLTNYESKSIKVELDSYIINSNNETNEGEMIWRVFIDADENCSFWITKEDKNGNKYVPKDEYEFSRIPLFSAYTSDGNIFNILFSIPGLVHEEGDQQLVSSEIDFWPEDDGQIGNILYWRPAFASGLATWGYRPTPTSSLIVAPSDGYIVFPKFYNYGLPFKDIALSILDPRNFSDLYSFTPTTWSFGYLNYYSSKNIKNSFNGNYDSSHYELNNIKFLLGFNRWGNAESGLDADTQVFNPTRIKVNIWTVQNQNDLEINDRQNSSPTQPAHAYSYSNITSQSDWNYLDSRKKSYGANWNRGFYQFTLDSGPNIGALTEYNDGGFWVEILVDCTLDNTSNWGNSQMENLVTNFPLLRVNSIDSRDPISSENLSYARAVYTDSTNSTNYYSRTLNINFYDGTSRYTNPMMLGIQKSTSTTNTTNNMNVSTSIQQNNTNVNNNINTNLSKININKNNMLNKKKIILKTYTDIDTDIYTKNNVSHLKAY